MDWELYERYRATLVLMAVVFASFLLLVFQHSSAVRHLRAVLVCVTSPIERALSETRVTSPVEDVTPQIPAVVSSSSAGETPSMGAIPEVRREIDVLKEDNKRLTQLLELKERRWPQGVAAHVVGRDPQRWFQEIVLDKGKEQGISMDDPVVAVVTGKEGLVGRITDVSSQVSKVMLIQDSLSSVAATVQGAESEDGVVEGSNSHDLYLHFLSRNSMIKIGDMVVTSGLGQTFPEGIPVGWVLDIGLDQRQLFLQARIRPMVQANQLHTVLVLVKSVS